MSTFYRKIRSRLSPAKIGRSMWANKKRTAILIGILVVFLYAFFNNYGIMQRIRFEREKTELLKKIEEAELEQQRLRALSKALESNKKEIEKVAREKYGMIREGERVYRVAPKK